MYVIAGHIDDVQRICADYPFATSFDRHEIERINAISSKQKKKTSRLVRKLLQLLIETKIEPDLKSAVELSLEYEKMGKPNLTTIEDLHINWSHTQQWVAVAAGNFRNGIDIEQERRYSENVVRKSLTLKEIEKYKRLDDRRKKQFFFERWVLKEAFVKAEGQGIGYGIDKLNLIERHPHKDIDFVLEDKKGEEWYLNHVQLHAGVHMGICSSSSLDFEDLEIDVL